MNPLFKKGQSLGRKALDLFSGSSFMLLLIGVLWITMGLHRMEDKAQKSTERQAREVLTAELHRERDRANRETVSRKVLELKRNELLWMLADSGSKIAHLQQVVKKAGPKVTSATVASTVTTINTSTASVTHLVQPADSTSPQEVTYTGFVDKNWVQGYIYADKDSIRLEKLQVRNEFEIWQRDERAGLFKPLQPVVYFKSLNPYTSVTDIQSYAVKPKKQPKVVRILKGVVIGLAIYGTADLASNFLL